MHKRNRGFTIVELLIVIIVIGILATLVLIAYNNVQEQARMTKIRHDISEMRNVVLLARSNTGMTMLQITGNEVTDLYCAQKLTGTNLATLPKNDRCWTDYYSALGLLAKAANVSGDVSQLVDPWGRPYLIDENEGVNGDCKKDTIAIYSQPFVQYAWSGDYARTPDRNIPLSGFTGCKVDPNG